MLDLATRTDFTLTPIYQFIKLELTQHTFGEIHHILTTTPTSHQCTKVYILHPALPITTKHPHALQGFIKSGQHEILSNRTIFHHLRITALSLLTPRDRSLYITITNILYAIIPIDTIYVVTTHRLHLFINPHNPMLYFQHVHDVNEVTQQRLEITTTLPNLKSSFTQTRRQPMLCN